MTFTVSWSVDADLKDTDDPSEAVDYALERIGQSPVFVEDDRGNRFVVDFANASSTRLARKVRDPVCECIHTCADDPATACSLSGDFHTHPDEPCLVHPDAPCP